MPDAPAAMVRCSGVTKRFGNHTVLDAIDLTVTPGERLAVIGPSGSGKTTLLRTIIGLEALSAGSVEVDGRVVATSDHRLSDKQARRARASLGFVFQQFNLFPHMTALENITVAPIRALKQPRERAEQRAGELLDLVGLRGHAHKRPAQLSGGEQQRVAIARALALNPKVMLFDEVTSALDPELVGEVLRVILDLGRTTNMTMLVVTHEMRFARALADRVVFIDGGRIVEQGPPEAIFTRPREARTRAFLDAVVDPLG